MSISVSSTDSNKFYKRGDVLHLTVTFDQAVDVTGTPQLLLATGNSNNAANYVSGSGTNTLTFAYAVQSGDTSADLDYSSANALQLNGGAITAAGADVALVLPAPGSAGSLGDNKGIVVDGIAPTLSIASTVAHLKIGDSAKIIFTFSENTNGSFTWADIDVSGGKLGPLNGDGAIFTAIFTPDADTDNGVASITVGASTYADVAGNLGGPGMTPLITFDTRAPAQPTVPTLAPGSDTGTSSADALTASARPTFTGTAEDGATMTLYDGGVALGSATVVNGTWSFAPPGLMADGEHMITAIATDAAGNSSVASGGLKVTIDTNAPTLAITSSAPTLKAGETATITFTFSEDPGDSFTNADVTVSNGTLGALSGSGSVRSAIFTPTSGLDHATASITVAAGSYADAAGNVGGAGGTPALVFDTKAPDAPDVPKLAAASDTGTVGDGITASTTQVIEGVAEAGATVTLYDGAVELASVKADANGAWTFAAHLGNGEHVLSAAQKDAAGNVSPASDPFRLTVTTSTTNPSPTPDPDPDTVTIIDGVPVTGSIVTLPGGVIGTKVQVPVITGAMAGADGFADIPLATSGGQTALLARLPVGYGLSSSGGSIAADGALAFLVASINAATPGQSSGDQGHLTQGGTAFLQGTSYGSLLVETVKPVSNGGAEGALVLTGSNGSGSQATALVIDAGGLSSSASLTLSGIGFGAVIGSAKVVAGSGMILSGDGASQDMTTHAGFDAMLLAGGGDDILRFAATPAATSGSAAGHALSLEVAVETMATLHGGLGNDTAVFAGARSDYEVAFHAGYVTVAAKDAPLSTAKVVNVEQLQFADGAVAVQNDAGLATLAGVYREVLGRQADLDGFAFWAGRHDAGASWGAIALEMIGSGEHGAKFDGNAAHDIGLLYTALFDRAADAGGLAFWQAAMDKGMSLEQVGSAMVASVEMTGHQVAANGWDFIV